MGFTLFILVYSCFGDRGLMKALSLKKELKEIEGNNQELREGNDTLKDYIYLLKNDEKYIEKVAREELGLVKDEELIYLFDND